MTTSLLDPSFQIDSVVHLLPPFFAAFGLFATFALLFWCASIGDEFLNVRSLLNQPAVLLGLERQLESAERAQFVVGYIQQLDLGFALFNVTLTTPRVLSLFVSMAVGLIIAFGTQAAGIVQGS